MSLGYCDVAALPDGSLAFVTAEERWVFAHDITRDSTLWQLPVVREWLHLRCGVVTGRLVAVGVQSDSAPDVQDGGTVQFSVDGASVQTAGLAVGVNSVAVGPDGIYCVRSSTRIEVIGLNVGHLQHLRWIEAAVGSQGIRDITPEGELRLADAWSVRRTELAGGASLTFSQPVLRGGVLIGQAGDSRLPGAPPDQIAGIDPTGRPFTAIEGLAYEPHLAALPDGRYAVCARTPGGPRLVLLPPFHPLVTGSQVPPARPLGPLSESRPDGELVDLGPFIVGDPALWPRHGTHDMHQVLDGDLIHFVKFGELAPVGSYYETWATSGDFRHLEDASNVETYSFSDPRWFPRVMRIGEWYAFDTGPHTATFRGREECQHIRTEPFRRKHWLVAVYPGFDCGPDLGVREVAIVAYDSSAGFHTAERGVELYFFARGAGWFRWESHASNLVYGELR